MKVSKPRLVAALLVASLMASPVILDACLFTCHGSAATTEPSCHHVGDDADLRLDAPPAPCGHDHSPTPTTMTAKFSGIDAHHEVLFTIASSASPHDVASPAPVVTNAVGPPLDARSRTSAPLRI